MDLKDYQGQIEQLLPLMRESDFNDLLDRILFGESTNVKFLVKMELNRLNAPCQRIIDLRDKYPDTKEFTFGEKRHFLDDTAIKAFEKSLKRFNNIYTMGVFEDVVNQKREPKNTEKTEKVKALLQAEHLNLQRSNARGAERMHFAIPVQFLTQDGQEIAATTSDISTTGLRVKVSLEHRVQTGTDVGIIFTGLQKEFSGPELRAPVPYTLVGQDKTKDIIWLRLARTQDPTRFDNFLDGFIKGNKHRYKINTDNLLHSVTTKGYEQYYLPLMKGLPLFFSHHSEPKLESVLCNSQNLPILEYWRDEKGENSLSQLLNPERIALILKQPGEIKETLIFSFIHHTESKAFFIAASKEELQQSGLKTLFLSFASRKASWRVYKLQLTVAEPTILKRQFNEHSPQNVSRIALEKALEVRYVGWLADVTLEQHKPSYQSLASEIKSANQLNRFVSKKQTHFEQLPFKFVQQRQEKRYNYNTLVELTTKAGVLEGSTQDFSPRGLKIALTQAAQVKKGEKVLISLPKLQSLTKTMNLSRMVYRVVGFNPARTIVHLCVGKHAESHTGTEFFNLLIESNPGKLSEAVEKLPKPGLELALRHLCCHHLLSAVNFVSRHHGHFDIGKLAINAQSHSLVPLLKAFNKEKAQFNLSPIFGDKQLEHLVATRLKNLPGNEANQRIEMYIHIDDKDELKVIRGLDEDFIDDSERKAFINHALQHGHFYSLIIDLTRVGKPDIESIQKELDYIAHYAIHKAKQVENELWAICALVELFDTTEETLYRFGLRDPQS
ncbi:PilZ domain-containing protein [Motilimonas sp. 1_MG-2023]|uniref:PilZ domain-containing protein n=1 Tax=Motilimonas sp. 1_MG-2023 TaxID=3062672 RepID=UPI0026E3E14C|nr:PilZ domain-containing protein [Motilimonas sp. 1_MG-2023]MDO6524604.1 PilZ domain-containing protein [Motilimonas sp. 1_MG-2023]